MAAAERVARTERKRRAPSMVVVFAMLAVREVGWCCLPQGGRERWQCDAEREREEGCCVRAGSYLDFLKRRQLSIARSSSRRPSRMLVAGVSLNGHAYSISEYISIA